MSGSLAVRRIELVLQVALILLLVFGVWRVLEPFLAAILFAVVIAVSTWPAYRALVDTFGGRRALASVVACILAVLVILTPAALLTASVADGIEWARELYQQSFADGPPPPPAWLREIPLVGDPLANYWQEVSTRRAKRAELMDDLAEPARRMALASGRLLMLGLLQATIAMLVLYALYRQGEVLAKRIVQGIGRLGGSFGDELVETLYQSISTVMVSVIGTSLAQAMVAALGFAIAGVPAPLLLGAATFVLSMLPIGPPLVWGGAAAWLFSTGENGWGVFMLAYGLLAISSVDNILKPLLIARGNNLPFAFTMMGIIGGVMSFGVIGVFLGPTLLVVGLTLSQHWLARARSRAAA